MRALVLDDAGGTPEVKDFQEPEAGEGQVVAEVVAASINPYDRVAAQMPKPLPRVVGLEAVGRLEDGNLVYVGQTVTPFGAVAEKTLAQANQNIVLPDGLEPGPALAIGVSGLAGWLPLSWQAQLKAGESVLILGATGVQGQIALQAAKLMGAGHIVAAGRDEATLEALKAKGADEIAVLKGDLAAVLKAAAPEAGYQVVIDSLYGEPFLGLLDSGTIGADSRVVILGGSAGQENKIGFRQLQATKGAKFSAYSTFYVPVDDKKQAYLAMAEHAVAGELEVDIKEFSLEDAAEAWEAQAKGPHQKIIIEP